MDNPSAVALAAFAGAALGVFFFFGLYATVRRGLASTNPAAWFLASLLARTAVVLAGFYVAAQGHWTRLAACTLGFVVARMFVVKYVARMEATVAH